MLRTILIWCAAVLVLTASPGIASATDFPNRLVTIIVPFGPGGPGDALLRVLAERLRVKWKQPVVVEYKPGAAGLIAHEFVAKSPPDGYTLLQASTAFTVFNILNKNMRFDPLKDLTIIAPYGLTAIAYVTNRDAPAKDMTEWVAWAKANPGKVSYGSLSRGVVMLTMELLSRQLDIKMTEIPYKNQADMVLAVMKGEIQLALVPTAQAKDLRNQGFVKPLFVVADSRVKDLPDTPTAAEAGLPGFRPLIWQSIMAPAQTPPAVTDKINADVAEIAASPEFSALAEKIGMLPFSRSRDEMKRLTDEQVSTWTSIAHALDIKPQ
jgi:tripartite-type tricarboxylate transporter receptor subunit TctC